MKITHICNSFLVIKVGSTVLACDPWVGITNYGGWQSYPIYSGGKELLQRIQPTQLYISHLHEDHLDAKLLSVGIKKNVPVLIKTFKDGRLLRRLEAIGFKEIIELPPWETYPLSDDLEVTIIPTDMSNSSGLNDEINYEIDTSILIHSLIDNTVFYNNVDSPISIEGLKKVREYVNICWSKKNIDIACISCGAASEYPQCFLNIDRHKEKEKIIESSLKNFAKKLDTLKNTAYFFAGGSYTIPGKFWPLNNYIAQPKLDQLETVIEASAHCKQYFEIEGGASIEKNGKKWVQTEVKVEGGFKNKTQAIEANKNLEYEYNLFEKSKFNNQLIDNLFIKAQQKYFTYLESKSISINWKVIIKLYEDLRVDVSGNIQEGIKPLKTLFLKNKDPDNSSYELICHMDYSLFVGLLKRKFIWNITLSGSIVLFERRPNIFVPTIPFSLNFLAI